MTEDHLNKKNVDNNLDTEFDFKKIASQELDIDQKDNEAIKKPEITNVSLNQNTQQKKPKKGFSIGKLLSFAIILVSVGLFGIFGILTFGATSTTNEVFGQDGEDPGLLGSLGEFGNILGGNPATEIKKTDERTNILILGTAQGGTDTIIIASYYHQEQKLATVNVPRDFYVSDKIYAGKINGLYTYAEARNPGGGARYVADFLGKEFGINMHYWVTVNFEGVEKGIDELGGITVEVDNSFTDCMFPKKNYKGYLPCQKFIAGTQQMDGETALIYARSRHGNNGEGSDFARSRRQAIVIEGILKKVKEKILSGELVLNPQSLNAYLDIFKENVKTSITVGEMMAFYNILKDDVSGVEGNFFKANWYVGNGFLCQGSSSDGAYIITYCGGGIAGRTSSSSAKVKAQSYVQNLLRQAELGELFNTNVAVLGNQSNEVARAYNNLIKIGFNANNVTYNKYHRVIPLATLTSVERTTFYITDPELRESFSKIESEITLDGFKVETQIPADVDLGKYKNYPIIAWSDTVSE